jgi:hypothetical protein
MPQCLRGLSHVASKEKAAGGLSLEPSRLAQYLFGRLATPPRPIAGRNARITRVSVRRFRVGVICLLAVVCCIVPADHASAPV